MEKLSMLLSAIEEHCDCIFTEVARFAQKWMDGKIVAPLYDSLSGREIKAGDFTIGCFGDDPFHWEDVTEEKDEGWSVELTDNCNVDEIFGTHVETEENDAYLNIYAHFSPDLSYISPYLTVVYSEDGSPHDFEEYKRELSTPEQSVLLALVQTYAGKTLLQKAKGNMTV